MTAADTLDAKLAAIIHAIEDAQQHEHEHGIACRATRRLPGDALRLLRRWRHATEPAADSGIMQCKSRATAPQDGQPTAGTPPQAREPAVQAPVVSIRMPPDLREQAEAFGRERRWSLAETTRVALEQLVSDQRREPERQERAA